MHAKTLIDKAAECVGGRAALARKLGVSLARVYDWGNGIRPCPIERQIILCDIGKLTDAECREHLREAAGASPPKASSTLTACVLGVMLSTASGLALLASLLGDWSTMYTGQTLKRALRVG